MEDSPEASPRTLETIGLILQETRRDVHEIKVVLGPLTEWKWRMQGAIAAIAFLIAILVGSGGLLTWRWWDQSIQVALLQSDIKNLQSQLTASDSKNYDQDIADIKSRISALETGAITQHIHK